jgi:GAF domain-containing protein
MVRRSGDAAKPAKAPSRRKGPSEAAEPAAQAQLARGLAEARDYQAATSELLKLVSSSTSDLELVLTKVVDSAGRLCKAERGHVFVFDGKVLQFAAAGAGTPEGLAKHLRENPLPLDRGSVSGRAALELAAVQIDSPRTDPEYALYEVSSKYGFNTLLGVPMLKGEELIGVMTLMKPDVAPFTQREIELVSTFADQAVIAVENARLLNELRESLQQQTATAEVLKVISRSAFDLQSVLDTLAESAAHLCEAENAWIFRRGGEIYRFAASYGFSPSSHKKIKAFLSPLEIKPGPGTLIGRTAKSGKAVQIEDVLEDKDYSWRELQEIGGYRSVMGTPLLRDGETVGILALSRGVVRPFTEKQAELAATFADQAVIAIENARLFSEVQQRTEELSEALRQQTTTAEVLRVISGSATDIKRVFRAVGESALKLCEADKAFLFRFDGEVNRAVVALNVIPELVKFVEEHPISPGRHSATARASLELKTVQIDNVMEDPDYAYGVTAIETHGTTLAVPILKGGELLGVITIYRLDVKPFTDKQIALLETFADQAAIAIENARLFETLEARNQELDKALKQQTATADVLKVISRSTFDLQTVLKTLVAAAARLCDADQGTIAREQRGKFKREASYGFSEEFDALISTLPVEKERGSATGRALKEGKIIHIPDVRDDPEYTFVEGRRLGGFRTILAVPMLREGNALGVLALTRREARPFDEKQIELVTTFADQAAIAIENVRLFESAEARSRELAASLEDLQTAQDRLVQTEKLASLGQLTAGIAHEIKNPLNFVNNFASVSAELVDELLETLQARPADGEAAAEVQELSELLRGNLEKIVEHGKRADSIVKNMLLHARQGSGEHRPVSVNALVEESLNLAYHGARAERRDFNITLERSLDPAAGEVDLYPQEITRVLLNLISNGFYATAKRRTAEEDAGYEPQLKATTRNLGERVEIVIRDNGTGIPAEIREKLFSPFFTTKPVGEGTGLGLSISHDIVVKQHRGSLEVESEPGSFTEFRIVLPRRATGEARDAGEARE